MNDKELQKHLLKMILTLEIKFDEIAETPLRHSLSEQIINIRKTILKFES